MDRGVFQPLLLPYPPFIKWQKGLLKINMKLCFLSILISVTLLTGCAAKSATHFTKKDVALVHINPKYCKDIPDSPDLLCDKVRVSLATVDIKDVK